MTKKRYVLPAVTSSFYETNIGIEVRCVSTFNKWVADLRRGRLVTSFEFRWTEYPDSTEYYYNLQGSFWPERRRDGIYVVTRLFLSDCYCDPEYTLAEFCRMLSAGARPDLGWCVTVNV